MPALHLCLCLLYLYPCLYLCYALAYAFVSRSVLAYAISTVFVVNVAFDSLEETPWTPLCLRRRLQRANVALCLFTSLLVTYAACRSRCDATVESGAQNN